ncbi:MULTISPECIES: HDOD domain-containing protein [Helicobacter]|uniref:HDOD domain-containing protein n=1 Tax=Helicobacter typhlonius TaxID=76936 RepID=A0A099UGH1_9HELI|nr:MULTISPECIES: HDOD domain-containing protein [Helicobacter]TLD78397.1 HDOD domain-containing protein [Helicobacter typhlonius]TLD87054.1 HDOD domain-containing protein [Helicobacter sp. MIT 03-1616]CUU39113.1 Predicted signal transduction protein [Helicobacter typhlonius]
MNELLLKTIDNLPPLPETIMKLQQYIDSSGSSVQVQGVVDIISKDPLLTGDLLRLANSPYYGFSREISTLNQVVSLLGINNVKNIAIANSLRDGFKIDVSPYGLDTKEFLGNCSREVDFISEWFAENDKKLSQILAPCAMLLRLGMMLYADTLIKNGKDKDFLAALKETNFSDISAVETEFYGLDHLTFLGYLFNHWCFDEVLIQTTAYITMPHAASDEVKKNSYALAIVTRVFDPYNGGSEYNMEDAIALIKEAKSQGIDFDIDRFLEILPPNAKANVKR